MVKGNTESIETDQRRVVLNPDQVTFDPFCRGLGDGVQPQVRLTGEGEYGTARFDGSAYTTTRAGPFYTGQRRDVDGYPTFPRRWENRLITRVEGEIENSRLIAFMQNIQPVNGSVGLPVEAESMSMRSSFNFLIPKRRLF